MPTAIRREIVEIADFMGDLQLSVMAQKAPQKPCSCAGCGSWPKPKIPSEDKRVVLVNPLAGCPMAEQIEPEMVEYFCRKTLNTQLWLISYNCGAEDRLRRVRTSTAVK